jgi:hypothetical protein
VQRTHQSTYVVALLLFASKPAAVPQAHIAPLLRDTAATRRPVALFSVQPARCAEALFPPHLRQKTGLGIHWKRPTVRERKRCASIMNNENKEASAVHSPGQNMAFLQSTHEPVILLQIPFPHCQLPCLPQDPVALNDALEVSIVVTW